MTRKSRNIKLTYRTVDGVNRSQRFTTLAGAQTFAHKWLGVTPETSAQPEQGAGGATSSDGIGRIYWGGCTAAELFPSLFSMYRATMADERQLQLDASCDGYDEA